MNEIQASPVENENHSHIRIADIVEVSNRAVLTADEIASNKDAPAHARVAAARLVLEVAGLVGAGRSQAPKDKEPSQLTTEELRARVADIDREIADRARLVAPKTSDIDRELLEN